jgi:hypothetical protein
MDCLKPNIHINNTGSLFYLTNIFCQFLPLLRRLCGRSAKAGNVNMTGSPQTVFVTLSFVTEQSLTYKTLNMKAVTGCIKRSIP